MKNSDIKQLWALLKQTGNCDITKQTVADINQNQINNYFASISTDPNHSHDNVIKVALQDPHRLVNHQSILII